MADSDEIGKGEHWTQNPPTLSDHDVAIWIWYHAKATQFVQEFNLMPTLFKELNLDGVEHEFFLRKINMIHTVMNNLKIKKRDREAK